jgi:anti-sigma factor RsiW
MSCTEYRLLLNAHVDNELDLRTSLEVEGHLATCPGCAAACQALRALQEGLRGRASYFAPPPALEGRLRRALRPDRRRRPVAAFAAAAALCLVAAVGALTWRPPGGALLDEVVAAHVRSLMANHLTDVASSDQHTVKPWFQGKLDFSLKVRDLSAQGFPLLGGRLDYLAGSPAAALVYRHDRHLVNLFIWPARDHGQSETQLSRRGYHLVRWVQDGMNCWAVSDLNEAQLLEFVRLLRSE